MMTSLFSSKKKKQKNSHHEAESLDGTGQHSNNNDDDALQNQHKGALKLPATQPKKSRLNTYVQEYAKTQLPRIDTNESGSNESEERTSSKTIICEVPRHLLMVCVDSDPY
jgi:hypothetical protein